MPRNYSVVAVALRLAAPPPRPAAPCCSAASVLQLAAIAQGTDANIAGGVKFDGSDRVNRVVTVGDAVGTVTRVHVARDTKVVVRSAPSIEWTNTWRVISTIIRGSLASSSRLRGSHHGWQKGVATTIR